MPGLHSEYSAFSDAELHTSEVMSSHSSASAGLPDGLRPEIVVILSVIDSLGKGDTTLCTCRAML